jgi:hypothetical protein
MAPRILPEPLASLETDLIDAFLAGLWLQKSGYPASHSDLQAGMRAVLRRYELVERAEPVPAIDDLLGVVEAETRRRNARDAAGDALLDACRLMGLLPEHEEESRKE